MKKLLIRTGYNRNEIRDKKNQREIHIGSRKLEEIAMSKYAKLQNEGKITQVTLPIIFEGTETPQNNNYSRSALIEEKVRHYEQNYNKIPKNANAYIIGEPVSYLRLGEFSQRGTRNFMHFPVVFYKIEK